MSTTDKIEVYEHNLRFYLAQGRKAEAKYYWLLLSNALSL